MRLALLAASLMVASCNACAPAEPPPPPSTSALHAPPTPPQPDPLVDQAAAHAACENLRTLRCPEGQASPGQVTCEQLLGSAAGEFFDLGAIAQAKSVAELRGLGVRCTQ